MRLFLIAAAVTFGGCFQATTLVKVNGDGSGTIEQQMLFSGPALAQMRQLAALGGGGGKGFDPFSEEQARQAAATIGTNVTYESSTPIVTDTAQGRLIVYSFADINQVRINQQPPAPGGVSVKSNDVNPDAQNIRFELTRQPGGNALLRILFPQPKVAAPPAESAPDGAPAVKAPSPEQIATIKTMFAGAKISIGVEPSGPVVKTNSKWTDGSRVTLLELEIDQVLADEAALARMQGVRTVEDAKAVLKDVPGLKVNLDREITIEFTPKK